MEDWKRSGSLKPRLGVVSLRFIPPWLDLKGGLESKEQAREGV